MQGWIEHTDGAQEGPMLHRREGLHHPGRRRYRRKMFNLRTATAMGGVSEPGAGGRAGRHQLRWPQLAGLVTRTQLARSQDGEPHATRVRYFKASPHQGMLRQHTRRAVIFEQVGPWTEGAAYLHGHVELSIFSVCAQLGKYHQLFNTDATIWTLILAHNKKKKTSVRTTETFRTVRL
jgi:hypothetical protein